MSFPAPATTNGNGHPAGPSAPQTGAPAPQVAAPGNPQPQTAQPGTQPNQSAPDGGQPASSPGPASWQQPQPPQWPQQPQAPAQPQPGQAQPPWPGQAFTQPQQPQWPGQPQPQARPTTDPYAHERQQMQLQLQNAQQQMLTQQQKFEQAMTEMKQRTQQAEMAGLTDEERIAYERDVAQQEAQEWQQRYQGAQQAAAYQQGMNQWANYYLRMGVPAQALDVRSFEHLTHSASAWLMGQLQQSRQQPQWPQGWPQPQQPYPPQPQQPYPQPQAQAQPQGWPPGWPQPQAPQQGQWPQPGQQLPQAAFLTPPGVTSTVPGSQPQGRRWLDIPPDEQEQIFQRFQRGQMTLQEMLAFQFG